MFEEKLKQFDHLYAISKNHATIDFYLISIDFKQLSNTKKILMQIFMEKTTCFPADNYIIYRKQLHSFMKAILRLAWKVEYFLYNKD